MIVSHPQGVPPPRKNAELFPDIPWTLIRSSGLTGAHREIEARAEALRKKLALCHYKETQDVLWVSFIGGTGTGKSTLFNNLCQKKISATGVERPKTEGPVAYVHARDIPESDVLFDGIRVMRIDTPDASTKGEENALSFVVHERDDLAHINIIDAPDVDSLDGKNRSIAETVYLLSDVVLFVTSQEKYADDIPSRFLSRLQKENKCYFILFNKADAHQTKKEIVDFYRFRNFTLQEDRLWMIPFLPSANGAIAGHSEFRQFVDTFFTILAPVHLPEIREKERRRSLDEIREALNRLLLLLEEEQRARRDWIRELDQIVDVVWRNLIEEMRLRFERRHKSAIKQELRIIFDKYDVLAKPRRYITEIVSFPLRLLGLKKGNLSEEANDEDLLRRRSRIDNEPVLAAVGSLNRQIFELLSPRDADAPLFEALRKPRVMCNEEEISARIAQEQELLAHWLADTFRELAAGISPHKKIGIYSASILWGITIISFEAVLGGGISLIEAAFDSVFAPFLTKGSVELFAYGELKKITGQLNARYESGLWTIIEDQKNRYIACFEEVTVSDETMASLNAAKKRLEELQ